LKPRAAIAAVVTVTLIFFAIRLGVVFLSKEVVPEASTEVGNASRGGPTTPPTREETKRDAQARLMALGSEAREAKDQKAAFAAFAAEEAVRREDCAGAKASLARAAETIPKDHRANGALESAERALAAYCAMVTD
jgi:hypothetical protein